MENPVYGMGFFVSIQNDQFPLERLFESEKKAVGEISTFIYPSTS